MKVSLDLKKSVDENAATYFEKAKKSRKKLVGVEETLSSFQEKQTHASEQETTVISSITKLQDVKRRWFEKFRWFITSEGYLVIGGRDATSNEIVVKKHTDKDDIVFHTDMAGSPFVIIKKHEELEGIERKELTKLSLEEAAVFTLIHSKAWKTGLSSAAVFWVYPDQVSKSADGALAKGSFMIYGKTNYIHPETDIAIGLVTIGEDVMVQCASTTAVSARSDIALVLEQGKSKPSQLAKDIRTKIIEKKELDVPLDAIIRMLPQGVQLKKVRKKKDEL